MTEVFLSVLKQSLFAVPAICTVLLIRYFFPRLGRVSVGFLWIFVAVSLLIPVRFASDFSLMPLKDPISAMMEEKEIFDEQRLASSVILPEDITVLSPSDDLSLDALPDEMKTFIYEVPRATPKQTSPPIPDVLAVLWIFGMGSMALYTLISYLRLKKRTAVSVCVEHHIRICDHIDTPFILGCFHPIICIPSDGITEDMQAAVLLHEKAHLVRFDHIKKPIAFVLCAVHWFNPLLWFAYAAYCRDLELFCDDAVTRTMALSEKHAYADALLACSIRTPGTPSVSCALAFGEVGVKTRIRRIFDNRRAGILVTVVCLLLISASVLLFLTVPRVTTEDIFQQDGFRVTAIAENLAMAITVPIDALDETAYTEKGQHFSDGEVVIHQSDATTVSLVHVYYRDSEGVLNRDSDPYLTFTFRLSYDHVKEHNVITAISRPNYQNTQLTDYTSSALCPGDLWIGYDCYESGLWSSSTAYGTEFSIGIDETHVRGANDDLRFTLTGFYDIFYEIGEPNTATDITMLTSGTVTGQSPSMTGQAPDTGFVTAFVPERCIYMTPLSSTLSLGGNNGELYALVYNDDGTLTTDFGRYDRESGRSRISFDVGEAWTDFPYTDEEWDALFPLGTAPDISRFRNRECLMLHRNDMLLHLDEEIWYCKTYGGPDGNRQMWSIHALIPEEEKGEAYWIDAPMLNHTSPFFRFRFDFPATAQLSVSCTDAQLSHSGQDVLTHARPDFDAGVIDFMQPFQIPGDNVVRLLPRDSDGNRVICAEIQFCAKTEGNPEAIWGTVYVEQEGESADGRSTYRATVVGEGLHITDDGADGAVISFQKGS